MNTDYKQIIFYLADMGQGLRKDLIEKIGLENYGHFRALCVLKEIFIDGKPGWQSTPETKRLKNFYREPTEEEKLFGCLSAGAEI